MRLKLGMVGGGTGAFIGGVHRIAARLDGHWDLVAGAFSSDPARAAQSAADLGVAPERSYDSWAAMAVAEAGRPDGIDAVAIVTPNHLHAPVATAFLRAGIPVICDKPLATTVEDAESLVRLVAGTGLPFILTQTYTGYPMVREARALIASGRIGQTKRLYSASVRSSTNSTDGSGQERPRNAELVTMVFPGKRSPRKGFAEVTAFREGR
jgi:predicted dehydrogenase